MKNPGKEQLFTHPDFDKYSFEEVPLERDIFLMDERWMMEYHDKFIRFFNGETVDTNTGYFAGVCARSVGEFVMELSWYPNIFDRYHEVKVSLPRSAFIACVGCWRSDEKPHMFVKSEWMDNLYLRTYSVFCMIDAIGVKAALAKGELTRDKLVALRARIDDIAKKYPEILFISFADSLLLKSNWSIGKYDSNIKYTYAPEIFLKLISEIQDAYCDTLQMRVYAVLTQGSNEYYNDSLLHISPTGNHISLNSLGVPFAQLQAIDDTARKASKMGFHRHAELYMDENFYHSLKLNFSFDKNARPRHPYNSPMTTGDSFYFYEDLKHLLGNLKN